MSKPNLREMAEKLGFLSTDPDRDPEERMEFDDISRALIYAEREIEFLNGKADGLYKSMDLACRRLASITICLWPGPTTLADGRVMDGTNEMKIKAHDDARAAATRQMS